MDAIIVEKNLFESGFNNIYADIFEYENLNNEDVVRIQKRIRVLKHQLEHATGTIYREAV
jgi:hypothetical protein